MSATGNKKSGRWIALALVVIVGMTVWMTSGNPPVFVEFRMGFLSDQVLVVRNISDQTLTGTIAFFKPNASDGKVFPLLLEPGERREFGALQIGDLAPSAGSRGYIAIDGYVFAKQFSLVDKESFACSSVPWFLAR